MKKLLSMLLCVCVLLSLAACGTDAPLDTGKTPAEEQTGVSGSPLPSESTAPTENTTEPKHDIGLQEDNPLNDALFNYGLVAVKVGEKWGFINMEGQMVIEPQFEGLGKFYQGVYAVNKDGNYSFINTKGETVLEPTPGFATYFTEDHCIIMGSRTVTENEDGTSQIQTSMYRALIDASGEVVVEFPEGEAGWPIRDGFLFTWSQTGVNLYSAQGEKLFEIEDCSAFAGDETTYRIFYDGLWCVEQNDKWGAVNTKGEWVIKPQFDELGIFENGIAKAYAGDYYGYVNTKGEWVIEPQFIRNYDEFSEGLVAAQTDSQMGYIDAQGNWKIVLPRYEWAILGAFDQGVARVMTDQGAGIINANGEWVLEPVYNSMSDFNQGVASVEIGMNNYGYINAEGQIIVAPEYHYTSKFYDDGYGVAQRYDGTWVILDTNGNVVIDGGFEGIGNYYSYYNDNGSVSVSGMGR